MNIIVSQLHSGAAPRGYEAVTFDFSSEAPQGHYVEVTLGSSDCLSLSEVALPQSTRGYLNAAVLSFAHTLGEFGVVLMVGGNIPGETRLISIAIYDEVESLNYAAAHQLSAVLLVFAFAVLLTMFVVNRRWQQR